MDTTETLHSHKMDNLPNVDRWPVWQKAHDFTLAAYTITRRFPVNEGTGLAAQLRQAATTLGANITEAYYSQSPTLRLQKLLHAHSELASARYYLLLSRDLGYGVYPEIEELAQQIDDLMAQQTSKARHNLSLGL